MEIMIKKINVIEAKTGETMKTKIFVKREGMSETTLSEKGQELGVKKERAIDEIEKEKK